MNLEECCGGEKEKKRKKKKKMEVRMIGRFSCVRRGHPSAALTRRVHNLSFM
jgi:hypothetical protein